MGININTLRFILNARSCGVDFSRTATIGRQGLHLTHDQLVRVAHDEFALSMSDEDLRRIHSAGFADDLLRAIGAVEVHSFDYSPYEGATVTHDFNMPIPAEYEQRYSVVLDGGSLEHVFNFPIAIRNCLRMVATGGVFIAASPTNNYMGHGFYQFSPELYYRVLDPTNGFQVESMVLHEGRESERWYRVPDPDQVRHRVELRNALPTGLLVLARRMSAEVLVVTPLQSDYVTTWNDDTLNRSPVSFPLLRRFTTQSIRNWLKDFLLRSRRAPPLLSPFDYVADQVARPED